MNASLSRMSRRRPSRLGRWARPALERLESRTLFAGHTLATATLLTPGPLGTAQASGFLATANQDDLYRIHLDGGDVLNVSINSQASGGALQSVLSVLDATGRVVAHDAQEGGNPRLTFQASAGGDYFVDVTDANATTGLYELDLRRQPGVPLTADLAGSSFRITTDTAAYADTISGSFTIENRGGADAGAFDVQVVLSPNNLFGAQSLVLTTFAITGLGAGQSFSPGSFTVTLPDLATATAAGLPVSGSVYVGLRIDPAGAVAKLNPFDQSGVHRGEDWEKLTALTAVTASGQNHSPGSADVLASPNSRVSAVLGVGQTDWYQITVPATGRLTVSVTATGKSTLAPRLTLAGPDGKLIVQTDAPLVQPLQPGTYDLAVSAQSGAGNYQLRSQFVPGNSPFGPPAVDLYDRFVLADVNGDGIPDLVVAGGFYSNTVSVFLGNGDGSFGPPQTNAVGNTPFSIVAADVNGDGKPDIISTNALDNTVSVLLGNGDGTFQIQKTFAVGYAPSAVAVADITGDGKPDLIVANTFGSIPGTYGPASVSVLRGNGDGTFQPRQDYVTAASTAYRVSVAVVDVNGDGRPDIIASTDYQDSGLVSVLVGNGDGTFQPRQSTAVPMDPYVTVAADVNGDGKPDLVAANEFDSTVSVMLGNGDGTFQPQQTFPASHGTGSWRGRGVAVADVNGDGKPDLVVSNSSDGTVSVLLGNGDGSFQPQETGPTTNLAWWVAVADLNGNGKPDIVVNSTGIVDVLQGNGDGTFESQPSRPSQAFFSAGAASVTLADLTGDGKADVVTAGNQTRLVSVLLGNGDGTFQNQKTSLVGNQSRGVAVADLNDDGKPDVVTANFVTNTVSVLLGDGDGTFHNQRSFPVGLRPYSVAIADLNGDGKPDIVVANSKSNTVSVLLGNGDGTFQNQRAYQVGSYPNHVVVADLRGDGKLDILTVNGGIVNGRHVGNDTISVLLGGGDGTFQPQITIDGTAEFLGDLAVADVNGDGHPDLAAANAGGNAVDVLLGNGNGTFQTPKAFPAGFQPSGVAVADLNSDGKPDVVVINGPYKTVSVLLGNGDGTFQSPQAFAVPTASSLAVADVNGDGRPDILTSFYGVSVLLNRGDGTFIPSSPLSGVGLRNTPYLANLTGDGLADSVVLDRSGNILIRKGLPGADSPFAPPVVLNPGRPARDLTVIKTPTGWAVAAADARFNPDPSALNQSVASVSLYTVEEDGTVSRTTAFTSSLLPTRIAAADLTGNSLDDLIVANSLDNSIQVAFQQPDGTFSAPITLPTGETPSDLTVADLNGDGLQDIAVTDQVSGDVSVFLTQRDHSFVSYRFRAGTGPYEAAVTLAGPAVTTLEQSVSLAAGGFIDSGRNDLVVVNRGVQSFIVLTNDGTGGFTDPQPTLTTSTSDGLQVNQQTGPVVSGDFNGDGKPDLAVLMEDTAQVWIYTNQGHGTFVHTFTITAGTAPTGLNLSRNPHTGQLDVLVGNQFGDVLLLQGKGDGTFQLPGRRTSLDVQNLGHGKTGVLVANQRTDRITVQASSGGAAFAPVVTLADGTRSTLAPGAVYWAKLDQNSPYFDAVVVASGGNAVLVYRGTGFDARGAPTFAAPVSYSVGTDPVSLTIADVNRDGIPDMLVADRGSNDVAELFGAFDSQGHWTATAGPRLASGGSGPIAVNLVADANSPGGFDLAVTNGLSGSVAMLPGRGQGFFDDRTPQLVALNTPVASGPTVVGTEAVFPTLDGALVGFDLATLSDVHTVFDSTEVSALGELPDGDLAVARADGNVELLRWDGTLGLFDLEGSLSPLSGLPSEPSGLAVLQSDNGLRVLVTQAGSNALFVFALPSTDSGPPAVSTTASESVPLPLPASLAVVLTLLSNPLPADTVASSPIESTIVPLAAGDAALAHASAESGGGDEPDASEDIALFVSPFAGPNPVEALERLRLFGPGSETDTAPPPERGPKPAEPPPVPRSSVPPVAPPDLVWADVSWLDNASPDSQFEATTVSVENGSLSQGEQDHAPVLAANLVSPALALLGLVGLQETWGWSTRADNQRTRSGWAAWFPEVNCP